MNRKNWLINIPRISITLFIFLNILAMITYSGTTLKDPSSIGYSFTNNFLSDLGRYQVFDNITRNFPSSLFFNSSMIIAGVALALFFLHIRTIFTTHSGLLYWLSIIGTIAGIAGGYSMIGVALTPADLYLQPHIIFNLWVFRFFLVSTVCYSWLMYKAKEINNIYIVRITSWLKLLNNFSLKNI